MKPAGNRRRSAWPRTAATRSICAGCSSGQGASRYKSSAARTSALVASKSWIMMHRPERLAEILREELMDLIAGELRDPRVGLAQVTEVKLAPDLHVAHVFVSVLGDRREELATLQGL